MDQYLAQINTPRSKVAVQRMDVPFMERFARLCESGAGCGASAGIGACKEGAIAKGGGAPH
ncbi:MAG: hypothetical protein ACI9W2_005353 [Gammaproteobacteria bacterium]|jgi:hypothetical protein